MAKKKEQPSKRQVRLENETFMHYLLKKHERLTVLFDFNVANRLDPSEEDIKLLHEEYDAFERCTLPWMTKPETKEQNVTQPELFQDKTTEKS